MRKKNCKVAVAHDWLVVMQVRNSLRKYSRVLQSDLFCIIRDSKNPIFNCDNVANVYSSLQRIPLIKNYKFFASLMPAQVENLT